MTVHYHALPVSPNSTMYTLAGKSFLVSYATTAKAQMRIADAIGENVVTDPGAFTVFRRLQASLEAKKQAGQLVTADEEYDLLHAPKDWKGYYEWVEPWLQRPTTHAIIPDVIGAASQMQDALLKEWPFGEKGWPVFHIAHNEERLLRLLDAWPVVCMGSSDEYWQVLSPAWKRRMDHLWNEISKRHRFTPKVHMLRGMQLAIGSPYPFASVDSSDVGQNHNRDGNHALAMANRWDAAQCPPHFIHPGEQFAWAC